MNWKNLNKHTPPINELVHVAHIITGTGAPEREGWESEGRLRASGFWSIKICEGYSHSKKPTHWKPKNQLLELKDNGNK